MQKEIFIQKAKEIHIDKYDYSLVNYINNKTKIEIICSKHGMFQQVPSDHLKGHGCSKCGFEKSSKLRNTIAANNFIKKSLKIHDKKYDYSLANYKNVNTKVKIICPKHSIFEQTPNKHLKGHGCSRCKIEKMFKTTDEFIKKAILIHSDKYDYSHVTYLTAKTKINIICKLHGMFEQTPNDHLNNVGCPICKQSHGETKITQYLNKHSIKYISQKKFNNCNGNKNKLVFDFYLPNNNILIEFDGKQHYIANKFFGGNEYLAILQKYDIIKTNYCKDNNIKLIRIKYDEDIENKLNEFLKL
jgi:very-short-patch-repair endonuclease/ribosomal protein L37E